MTTAAWSIDIDSCCELFGGEFREVRPACTAEWPTPLRAAGEELDLLALLPDRIPAIGVVELGDVDVDGASGWISVGGMVARDHTWYGAALESERDPLPPPGRTVHLGGTTVTMLSDFAEVNYGHLLLDVVPRRSLLEAAGIDLSDVDHVLCCAPGERRDFVLQLGLPVDRIVWAEPGARYRTDRLIAPSFPGVRRALQPWAARSVRRWLAVPPDGTGRRLYVVRHHDRVVRNQAELDETLADLGFESVDPASSSVDQRALFAAAEVVVGVAGSALTNTVFCQPGSRVVELLPTDHVFPYHFALAVAAGLGHRYLAVRSASHREPGAVGPSRAAVDVDPELFDQVLRDVCGELGSGHDPAVQVIDTE